MPQWSLDDIPWEQFDPAKVKPEFLSLVKAASMVEHNGRDYARYLCEVFADDELFQQTAIKWAEEEVQHGKALRKWAELADPDFNFERRFNDFTSGYRLPENVAASVRGSRAGELIARCMVEIGTSSYYTAIKDDTDEPVLKALCARIAADELRHYKLFYTHLQHYLKADRLSLWKRARIALGRILESEDDELAYAFYAAHKQGSETYNRKRCSNRYMACVGTIYKKESIDRMTVMALKAIGLKPHTLFNRCASYIAWKALRFRVFAA